MADKKAVLIIDDEPDLLDLLCMTIQEEGFETLSATNGEEGLKLFNQHHPKLVIADQNLPKKNGDEILQNIKGMDPNTVVVIMSGAECPPGFDATIRKPIDFDDFAALVKKLA